MLNSLQFWVLWLALEFPALRCMNIQTAPLMRTELDQGCGLRDTLQYEFEAAQLVGIRTSGCDAGAFLPWDLSQKEVFSSCSFPFSDFFLITLYVWNGSDSRRKTRVVNKRVWNGVAFSDQLELISSALISHFTRNYNATDFWNVTKCKLLNEVQCTINPTV